MGLLYILSVPFAAAMGTARGLSIGGFNYTGWLWMAYLAAGLAIFCTDRAVNPGRRIAFPFRPWLVWFGFIWFSLLWVDDPTRRHLQEALQISMPLMVGCIASMFIQTERDLSLLLKAYRYSLVLLVLSVAVGSAGDIKGVDMATGLRPLGLTASLVGCIFLANLPGRLVSSLIGWGICVLISFVTGARTSTIALIILLFFNPLLKGYGKRIVLVSVIAALSLVVFNTPQFQSRFFYSGQGTLADLFRGDIRGSGRFDAWPYIWNQAWRRPVLGYGVGSAYDYVPTVWTGMNHVQNDYLRVGFELGFVGFGLYLAVFVWQTVRLWGDVVGSRGIARWALAAAFLGMVTYLVNATTGNPLGYNIWFMDPLFALIGAAYGTAQHDRPRR